MDLNRQTKIIKIAENTVYKKAEVINRNVARIGNCARCGICCRQRDIWIPNIDDDKTHPDRSIYPGKSPNFFGETTMISGHKVICHHLKKKVEGRAMYYVCECYENRPDICKEYPKNPLKVVEQCSYMFITNEELRFYIQLCKERRR